MNRFSAVCSAFIGFTVLSASLGSAPASCQVPLKIAFVRPEYILSQYEPYRTAMQQVQAYEKSETDKIQKMIADFQKQYEEAQKQAPLMTEEKRNEKLKDLETKRSTIEKAEDDLLDRENGRLFKKHEELVQPIFDRLNRVLERVGQDEKYDFIFNVTADTQNILYADKKFDISDKVAELLKKEPETADTTKTPATQKAPQPQQKK